MSRRYSRLCPYCRRPLRQDAQFCGHCGAQVQRDFQSVPDTSPESIFIRYWRWWLAGGVFVVLMVVAAIGNATTDTEDSSTAAKPSTSSKPTLDASGDLACYSLENLLFDGKVRTDSQIRNHVRDLYNDYARLSTNASIRQLGQQLAQAALNGNTDAFVQVGSQLYEVCQLYDSSIR